MTDFLTATLPSTTDNTAPPVLLSYQQAWVADDAQLKVGEKSRRIGLTWAEASDNVLIAAAAHGSNVFYISATQDMAIEYIEACAMWARAFNQAAGEIEEGIVAQDDRAVVEDRRRQGERNRRAFKERVQGLGVELREHQVCRISNLGAAWFPVYDV